MQFQFGDIVVGNNPWLLGLLGVGSLPGIITYTGAYSSVIYLFTVNEDITLLNEYIDKIHMDEEEKDLKIGDLVELKPEIKKILTIKGAGTITSETLIRANSFNDEWTEGSISAFLVYFPEEDYEFTIPKNCLMLFSSYKID